MPHTLALSSPLLLSVLLIYFFLYHFTGAPQSSSARAVNTHLDALCNESTSLRRSALSHASTLQVVDHLLDDLVNGLVILEIAIAVLGRLVPEADHDTSHCLADAGAATTADKLDEAVLAEGGHVLLATHADASLSGRSVATGGLDGTQDLVNLNLLYAAIHVLQIVRVGFQLNHA